MGFDPIFLDMWVYQLGNYLLVVFKSGAILFTVGNGRPAVLCHVRADNTLQANRDMADD